MPTQESSATGPTNRRSMLLYAAVLVGVAMVTAGLTLLLANIIQRQAEGKQRHFQVTQIDEWEADPAVWGANFPRQYDSYQRTVDVERTRYGGSEDVQKLDAYPIWRRIFDGYAFALDYREERGHAYMLSDQRATRRVTERKQPGACLHCHASNVNAYREMGLANGAEPGPEHWQEQIIKGFELINSMPYSEATHLVSHPIACIDCHTPNTMQLRITKPAFMEGIDTLAHSDAPLPHLPSIERWRAAGMQGKYDPNVWATRQEMRSLVCAQCHVEYYFKGDEKRVTYPWHNGLKMEQAEQYYDEVGFKDWAHALTGAPTLKAQHPEFEMWSQGIHARSGVACADCHMPYQREGAVKVSDHWVRSPMLNVAAACQTCHNYTTDEIEARVATIQDRTFALLQRGEQAVGDLIDDLEQAVAQGYSDEQLAVARDFQRKAQWRLDYVSAENSMGFHAPQEAARILAEAADLARQGQLELLQMMKANPPGGAASVP